MYYFIENHPIFISRRKYLLSVSEYITSISENIDQDALALKSISARIARTKDDYRQDQRMHETLVKEIKADRKNFFYNWMWFDFQTKESVDETFDILYDWSHLNGIGQIIDFREIGEQILADYRGQSMAQPVGKLFSLRIESKQKTLLGKILTAKQQLYSDIIIDTSKVKRIIGTLEEFFIISDYLNLQCNNSISVIPSDWVNIESLLKKELFKMNIQISDQVNI